MSNQAARWIDEETFHREIADIESSWQRVPIGAVDLPIIESGEGYPLVFVPILEHLEFVYARQLQALRRSRRVILYRRRESRTARFVGISERAEELRQVLDRLSIERADLLGHGDAAMVLLVFAARYPQRCRSLIVIAQGAEYRIAPHPFIWLLHELYLRLPVEHVLPAWFLRRTVINYIVAHDSHSTAAPRLPRQLIEEQFRKIALWPFVYKYSVLPVIHSFDIRAQLALLTMPVLLINRGDDALSPERETRWLAAHLPHCAGYDVVLGGERFFLYSRAEEVTPLIETFLDMQDAQSRSAQEVSS